MTADLGGIAEHVTGVETVRALAADFPPEAVTGSCGVAAEDIRQLARDIATSPSAAVYGRIGTSTVRFGTLGSWLVASSTLTGNLDRSGGRMFRSVRPPLAPLPPGPATRIRHRRWHSRVSGYPRRPQVPDRRPGRGDRHTGRRPLRAVIMPSRATWRALGARRRATGWQGARRDRLHAQHRPYLNETTTCHADVIPSPPPPPSQCGHFDFAEQPRRPGERAVLTTGTGPGRAGPTNGDPAVADCADPLRRRAGRGSRAGRRSVIAATPAKETADRIRPWPAGTSTN